MGSNFNLPTASEDLRGEKPHIAPNSEVKLQHLVDVLRRGKRWFVIGAVAGLLLAGVATLLMHTKYTATATIEISKNGAQPLGVEDLSGIGAELSTGDELNTDLLTELSVISSNATALSVIQKLNLADVEPFAIPASGNSDTPLGRERGLPLDRAPFHRDLALAAFRSRLSIEVVKGTRLMSISFTARDANMASSIANAVVSAAVDQYTGARTDASSVASQWLSAQLSRLAGMVDESQKKVDEYERQHNVSGLTTSSPTRAKDGGPSVTFNNVPLDRLLELNRNLTNAEVLRTEKEVIYKMAQTQDPEVVLGIGATSLSFASGAVNHDPTDLQLLQQLRQQQAQIDLRKASASSKYGDKNPAIVEITNQSESVKSQISAELSRIQARAYNDLVLARHAEDSLKQQVAAQQAEVARTGDIADALVILQQQAESDRTLYQDLHTKLEEANVVAGIRASNIVMIDPARAPSKPASPKPAYNLLAGVALGLVCALLIAFTQAFTGDRVYDQADAERTRVGLLGSVPDVSEKQTLAASWLSWSKPKSRPLSRPFVVTAPESLGAEAFRSLRTSILETDGHAPRKLLVSSGSHEEGRTTTCINLAAAFAVLGHRCLILDADLRSNSAPPFLTGREGSGLSTCLAGSTKLSDAIVPSPDVPNLFVLGAGPRVLNPSELIASTRFVNLLAELETQFDYIFLDSPPVLQFSDARVLARHVDAVLLIARAGITTKFDLNKIVELLPSAGVPAAGVCLVGA